MIPPCKESSQCQSLIHAHQRQFAYRELDNSKQLTSMSNCRQQAWKLPTKQWLLQITHIELYVKTLYFLSTAVIKTGNNYTCASPLHFWINIHFLEASWFWVTYYTSRDFFLNEEFGILAVTIMVPTFNALLLPSLKYTVNTRLSVIRSSNPLPTYPAAKLIKRRTYRYGR
jgi:hypothetical protein